MIPFLSKFPYQNSFALSSSCIDRRSDFELSLPTWMTEGATLLFSWYHTTCTPIFQSVLEYGWKIWFRSIFALLMEEKRFFFFNLRDRIFLVFFGRSITKLYCSSSKYGSLLRSRRWQVFSKEFACFLPSIYRILFTYTDITLRMQSSALQIKNFLTIIKEKTTVM